MFLRTTGRRVVIAGGGEQAAQKARLILKTDAEIVVAAPTLCAELAAHAEAGRLRHEEELSVGTFANAALVFVATGCAAADVACHALAKAAGAVVNVVDRPELCDALTPSIVDRDPVVVAIGTEGTAPVLGRRIRAEIEERLSPRLGALAALAGRLREAVALAIPQEARRAFWVWALTGEPARLHRQGNGAAAEAMLRSAIAARRAPDGAGKGHIALVGAGPGARDLLSLRAVERMQEADVIFYDRLVDPDVLDLARRDAERIYVGKEVGAPGWSQDRICRRVLAEARSGRRVVRLKSGDPSVFGRATEEIAAARDAGLPVEVVPGITAASAAAASARRSLTERGETDTVVIVTGACRPGDPDPDWGHHVRPGTTLAIYMGVGSAARITAGLVAAGASIAATVEIAVAVSTPDERWLEAPLGGLARCLEEAAVSGQAILFVRFPKSAHVPAAIAAE